MPLSLEYQKIGRGPAVIVLHGLFGMSDNWLSVAKTLQEKFTFYLLDQRNHGRSPHADTHSYKDMSGDVQHFIDQHKLKAPHILGHSMGGKTAMRFALDHPSEPDKLVVVDIAPRAYKKGFFDEYISAMQNLDLASMESRGEIEQALSAEIDMAPATRKFLLKNVYRDDDDRFRWRLNLDVLCDNLANMMQATESETNFEGEALFIGGGSGYIAEDDMGDVRRLFPRAQFREISGAGHWVHATKQDEFCRLLSDFLSQ